MLTPRPRAQAMRFAVESIESDENDGAEVDGGLMEALRTVDASTVAAEVAEAQNQLRHQHHFH